MTLNILYSILNSQEWHFGKGVTGAAFLGGAGFGFGVGLLSYSILHRYFFIRNALFEKGLRTEDWDEDYYMQFYLRYNEILSNWMSNDLWFEWLTESKINSSGDSNSGATFLVD